ncbi:GNAT family N-acetyltransferase [Halosquirtibacter laminarini]|uniref:GNAT family N-acetyltransferase n=1 Tax=Halosquirtibacter laminarini TaxID=3374600 RepID=A0AC61NR68_9BACT|nr:GNAT family N-acetyltransferase [Prolixibacteraceae bacterium]
MDATYTWKQLDALETEEWFTMFQLRQEIFVVEQNCPYLDLDEEDRTSFHLLVQSSDTGAAVLATLRVFVGDHGVWHIGRVATSEKCRGKGVARHMMEESLAFIQSKGGREIEISAQSYLEKFYCSLDFVKSSDEYLLDGLPHIDMHWTIS